MNDPFRNYDAWVTRDPFYDADDALDDAWYVFVDKANRPVLSTTVSLRGSIIDPEGKPLGMLLGRSSSDMIHATVPPEAFDDDHPDHAIYLAWRELQQAIDDRSNRLQAEELDAAEYVDEDVFRGER